jgi:hypothetical protein
LTSINNLGSLLKAKGDLDGAEALYREALEARREVLGDRHPDTLSSINNLGALLKDKGGLDGAQVLLAEAVAGAREVLGAEHPHTKRFEFGLQCVSYCVRTCVWFCEAMPHAQQVYGFGSDWLWKISYESERRGRPGCEVRSATHGMRHTRWSGLCTCPLVTPCSVGSSLECACECGVASVLSSVCWRACA